KYTPIGGTVLLDASPSEVRSRGGYAISVTDSGPGIAADQREAIFERFYRLDSARTPAGAGLGLPIARWIATAHGGTPRVDPAPHGGSCFTLWLPVADDTTADQARIDRRPLPQIG